MSEIYEEDGGGISNVYHEVGSRARVQNYLRPEEVASIQHLRVPEFAPGEVTLLLQKGGSESSFNDDGVPPSEEEFFSTDWEERDTDNYVPPITKTIKALIYKILNNEPEQNNSPCEARAKTEARLEAIHEFQNFILKKRAIKAYKRLSKLKKANIEDPEQAAFFLEKLELRDKKLIRPFYYEDIEPPCYTNLLKKRKRAIRRKYELYAIDSKYRTDLRNRTLACVKKIVEFGDVSSFRASELYNTAESIHQEMGGSMQDDIQHPELLELLNKSGQLERSASEQLELLRQSEQLQEPLERSEYCDQLEPPSLEWSDVFEQLDQSEQLEKPEQHEQTDGDEEEISSDTSTSSFYDHDVPESEALFFSSEWEEDKLPYPGPVSRTLDKYHRLLNKCRDKITDDGITMNRNLVRSAEIEAQFRNYIENKRATKAFAKFKTILGMNLDDPREEAERLCHCEIVDKKLRKSYYFEKNEPECYKVLLGKRRRAIVRKYGLYLADPKFCNDYKRHVYSNFIRAQPAPLFDKEGSEEEEDEGSSESSFNDSEIPTSEEEFLSDIEIMRPTAHNKPITRTKEALFEKLMFFELDNFDNPRNVHEKRKRRLATIQIYKNQLLDRRRMKAATRIKKLKKMGEVDLGTKALQLLKLELRDKKLDRNFYYYPNEDKEITELLLKRRRAIVRKCQKYQQDKKFRENLEKRYMIQARRMKPKPIKPEYDMEMALRSIPEPPGYERRRLSRAGDSLLVDDHKIERRRDRATAGIWPPRRESAPPIMKAGKDFEQVSLHYIGAFPWQRRYTKDILLGNPIDTRLDAC